MFIANWFNVELNIWGFVANACNLKKCFPSCLLTASMLEQSQTSVCVNQQSCHVCRRKVAMHLSRDWTAWRFLRTQNWMTLIVSFPLFSLDFPHCFSPWCYRCQCPPQLEGPDCQQMRVSFLGNGYAWFPPIRPCFDSHLSLEFMTEEDDGLLLYAGPMATLMPGDSEDYMAIGKERVCIIRCVPRGLWAVTALKPAT